MDRELWWWSVVIVVIVGLGAGIVIDAHKQNRQFSDCKQQRIRAFPKEFFTWNGMVELNQAGLYQPKCL
jgi:hypothetical protein